MVMLKGIALSRTVMSLFEIGRHPMTSLMILNKSCGCFISYTGYRDHLKEGECRKREGGREKGERGGRREKRGREKGESPPRNSLLEQRRVVSRLSMLYKIRNHLVAIAEEPYLKRSYLKNAPVESRQRLYTLLFLSCDCNVQWNQLPRHIYLAESLMLKSPI